MVFSIDQLAHLKSDEVAYQEGRARSISIDTPANETATADTLPAAAAVVVPVPHRVCCCSVICYIFFFLFLFLLFFIGDSKHGKKEESKVHLMEDVFSISFFVFSFFFLGPLV